MGPELMRYETSAEQSQEPSVLNRFDHLVELMMRECAGKSGWLELPPKNVIVDGEPTPAKFFLFIPKPIEGYESTYSPSIAMQLGQMEYAEDGKPFGDVEKAYVRRPDLEESSENAEKAEAELTKIENVFVTY